MSDPANATVESGALPSTGSPRDDTSGAPGIQIGARWRSLVIESAFPGKPRCFLASHLSLMESVQLRVFPVDSTNALRGRVWDKLTQLNDPRILRCLEVHEEDGWRYEITAVPPPMTLREWMAAHRPGFADIEALTRQIGAALGALHENGIVHLNLRPEAIHIDDSKGEPAYMLGALHEATLHGQPELVPVDVDPLYAPPEAAGLTRHPPGARLCAWDWWSFGRVLQEFLIGKHVLAAVLDRDVSRLTPEVRHRAEQLLLEREPPGVKPGALDFTIAEAGCMPLLRGLLTSAPDARWGLDAVQRWLARETVRDHYDLPRNARMWNWKGRVLTLVEAAEFFTRPENWDTGEDMLFHPHEEESLAHFLNEVPAHREDWERLQGVCDLTESNGWELLPVVARRTVTAALGWLTLAAGAGGRPAFRVRGHTIDAAGYAELLKAGGVDTGVMLATAILSPAVIQAVEPLDSSASRLLQTVATRGGAALHRAVQQGWIDADDTSAQARLLELSLQSGAVLRERVDLLRATHATNANEQLAQLFSSKSPDPAELVLLAFTAEAPERHGYVTHENWRRQQCAALKRSADAMVRQLFWMRLHQLLRLAPLWGAKSTIFGVVLLAAATAAGLIARSAAPAAAIAVGLLGSRAWVWWRVRGMVKRFDSSASPWGRHDGLERCLREVVRIREAATRTSREMADELHEIRRKLADLATPTVRPPTVVEPSWWDVRGAIALAVLVCVGAFVYSPLVPPKSEPGAPREAAESAEQTPLEAASDSAVATEIQAKSEDQKREDPAALIASGRFEVVDDGFGRRLRGPLEPWPYRSPPVVARLQVEASAPASPEQAAFALVSGSVLLRPYARKAVSAYLAVKVPTTRGFGIMIFNARDRELFRRDVLLLRSPLAEKTWYEFDGRRVLYLGTPLKTDAEISLAPPG